MTTDSSAIDSGDARDQHATVTFLLADIASSTKLLEALGDEYPAVVFRARELLRSALDTHDGVEVDAEGDSLFAAFPRSDNAMRAAIEIQRSFHAEAWPSHVAVRMRIGIHTGQPQKRGGKYFGLDVHRTARIAAAARGGRPCFRVPLEPTWEARGWRLTS